VISVPGNAKCRLTRFDHECVANNQAMSFRQIVIMSMLLMPTDGLVAQLSPYPASPVIKEIRFQWPSHIRLASGSDNWPVTWADDGHQYTVWGDGGGFGGTNSIGRSSIGIARIEGSWHNFNGTNVWGGEDPENSHSQSGKSYGIVCMDGVLYMWVGLFETKTDPFKETKIAYSKDHGASWLFAHWSFTREDGVMMPTVCNYGQNYGGAKDDAQSQHQF
jgi:hypothetical protein